MLNARFRIVLLPAMALLAVVLFLQYSAAAAPVCGDSVCQGETCTSCPADCLGTNQICCNNQAITADCSGNAGCDDSNPLTTDICNAPGSCQASCSNAPCSPACSGNADCSDGDPSTTDYCAEVGTCNAYCFNLGECGNGICSSGENRCNCSADCGSCEGTTALPCRKFGCVGATCTEVWKPNCCGNTSCDYGENFSSCSADCIPKEIKISVIAPASGDYFLHGERVLVKADVSADNLKAKGAKAKAAGFFGIINLYDDGAHDDDSNNDGIFANSFTVDAAVDANIYPITMQAELAGVIGKITYDLEVNPRIDVNLFSREYFRQGSLVDFNGIAMRKGVPVSAGIDINIVSGSALIFDSNTRSSAQGEFSGSYHSTTIDPEGAWQIWAHASDDMNNSGFAKIDINIGKYEMTSFLGIELLTVFAGRYERGEKIKVAARVLDGIGEALGGAVVKLLSPSGAVMALEETASREYSGIYTLDWAEPTGTQKFEVSAIKDVFGKIQSGKGSFNIEIGKAGINAEILNPETASYKVGDELKFSVRLTYPSGELVEKPVIDAKINGKKIEMQAAGKGVYSASHIISIDEQGGLLFSLSANDGYGNDASKSLYIGIRGISLMYYIRASPVSVALFFFAALIALMMLSVALWRIGSLAYYARRGKELLAIKADAQTKYFKKGIISRETYDKLREEYEPKIEEIRKSGEDIRRQMEREKKAIAGFMGNIRGIFKK